MERQMWKYRSTSTGWRDMYGKSLVMEKREVSRGESEAKSKSLDHSGDQMWGDRCGGSGFESEVCLQFIKVSLPISRMPVGLHLPGRISALLYTTIFTE
ncbi:hypothetical protein E2C01_067583 [Portunus trituberculatus]|uniref:Uncharacterized protein n=1 Tax=Portunus trituberculatus TaxID=210409 RepID=A0A5B7HLE2_PORTR|nr:hypothetical protein [Portunus trituberculatus]